jgi:hypothetical protein
MSGLSMFKIRFAMGPWIAGPGLPRAKILSEAHANRKPVPEFTNVLNV